MIACGAREGMRAHREAAPIAIATMNAMTIFMVSFS
jgi:hypothetical protein